MMTKLEQVQVCLPREIMGKTHPNATLYFHTFTVILIQPLLILVL